MKTWIKLYTEILADPKMGRLTDRQYRTCINIFALAGQVDQAGILPAFDDIAYYLRLDGAALLDDMRALAAVGILTEDGGDWIVTQFAERQARNPSETPEEVKRRVTEYRQRKAGETQATVTAGNVSVTPCNDIEGEEKRTEADKSRGEKTTASPSSSFQRQALSSYQSTIGLVSGATQAQEITATLADLEARHIEAWWDGALKVAADNNRKSWAYVRGVLRNCLSEGKPPGSNGNGRVRAPDLAHTSPAIAAFKEFERMEAERGSDNHADPGRVGIGLSAGKD